MRLTRIFTPVPLQSGAEISLPPSGAHHVARVLRLRVGAPLIVFDGVNGEYRAEIAGIAGDKVMVRLGEYDAGIGASGLRITLVQGVSRGERMDWTLQKATELGVSRIVPVLTARSVVRLDEKQATKKQEHWRNVVIGACEQSGCNHVPEIAAPIELREYLSNPRDHGMRLVLDPAAEQSLAALAVSTRLELLIGPEGGLAVEELQDARQAGFTPVHLGPRILRTETAAVVALAVLQAAAGDLR